MDSLRYVTPIICFSSAKVEVGSSVEGVYVISSPSFRSHHKLNQLLPVSCAAVILM
jgi:hypothetical protein